MVSRPTRSVSATASCMAPSSTPTRSRRGPTASTSSPSASAATRPIRCCHGRAYRGSARPGCYGERRTITRGRGWRLRGHPRSLNCLRDRSGSSTSRTSRCVSDIGRWSPATGATLAARRARSVRGSGTSPFTREGCRRLTLSLARRRDLRRAGGEGTLDQLPVPASGAFADMLPSGRPRHMRCDRIDHLPAARHQGRASFRAGDAGLRLLAYGTREPNDIAYYPRSGKVFVRGVGVIGRLEPLDYWEGED